MDETDPKLAFLGNPDAMIDVYPLQLLLKIKTLKNKQLLILALMQQWRKIKKMRIS